MLYFIHERPLKAGSLSKNRELWQILTLIPGKSVGSGVSQIEACIPVRPFSVYKINVFWLMGTSVSLGFQIFKSGCNRISWSLKHLVQGLPHSKCSVNKSEQFHYPISSILNVRFHPRVPLGIRMPLLTAGIPGFNWQFFFPSSGVK